MGFWSWTTLWPDGNEPMKCSPEVNWEGIMEKGNTLAGEISYILERFGRNNYHKDYRIWMDVLETIKVFRKN